MHFWAQVRDGGWIEDQQGQGLIEFKTLELCWGGFITPSDDETVVRMRTLREQTGGRTL